MAYNGSGTFLINTAGQPVVSGTVISSTAFNALTADLATGLSTAITKDGQTTVTANIPMSTYKFTGLGVGSAATDSANLSQVQSTVTKLLNSVSGADTITATASPTLAAYAAGQMFYFVAAGDNTTSVTLNIDSLGAKAVTRDGATALAAADIKSGEVVVVVYDGTRFQVVSQLNSAGDARFANVSIASSLYVGGVSTFVGNAGFSANVSIASALSVGGVAAITGATTIGGNLTLSGGTANGVLYLNGSKVATSGSALVFDGSNLGVGGSPGYRVDVTGGTSSFAPSNSVGAIRAQNNSTTALELHIRPASGKNGFISFTEDTIADRWVMGVLAGNAGLLWGTGNPGSYSEQMRLTSTGLGIGTASPGAKLHVIGTTADQIRVGTAATEHYRIGRNASDGLLDFYGSQTGFQGYRFGGIDGTWAVINSSGNLGLGVTPSAWGSGWTAFQLSASGAALSGRGSTSEVYLSSNAHFNGSNWIYKLSATAAYYGQDAGVHKWFNAASGTAGNAISFTQAMTLSAAGDLFVGATAQAFAEKFRMYGNYAVFDNASYTGFIGQGSSLGTGTASDFAIRSSNALAFLAGGGTERARITSGGDFKWSDNGASGDGAMVWVRNGGDGTANSGRLALAYNTVNWTPSSTPDTLRWDGNSGRLTILTSAKKYKRNITPVTDQQLDKALKLEPSYYQRLEYEYWEYGFIADQADEIGLSEIVSRVNGEINGLDYEKIGVFAIGLIKRHQKTLEQQQAIIEELKAKVAALEAK